jgi:hypothetical protein
MLGPSTPPAVELHQYQQVDFIRDIKRSYEFPSTNEPQSTQYHLRSWLLCAPYLDALERADE